MVILGSDLRHFHPQTRFGRDRVESTCLAALRAVALIPGCGRAATAPFKKLGDCPYRSMLEQRYQNQSFAPACNRFLNRIYRLIQICFFVYRLSEAICFSIYGPSA
jgi:hypothetical protein